MKCFVKLFTFSVVNKLICYCRAVLEYSTAVMFHREWPVFEARRTIVSEISLPSEIKGISLTSMS